MQGYAGGTGECQRQEDPRTKPPRTHGCSRLGLLCRFASPRPRVPYVRESSPSRELDPRVRLRRLLVAEGAPRKAARPHGCSRLGLLRRFAFPRLRVSYVRASSASREH